MLLFCYFCSKQNPQFHVQTFFFSIFKYWSPILVWFQVGESCNPLWVQPCDQSLTNHRETIMQFVFGDGNITPFITSDQIILRALLLWNFQKCSYLTKSNLQGSYSKIESHHRHLCNRQLNFVFLLSSSEQHTELQKQHQRRLWLEDVKIKARKC